VFTGCDNVYTYPSGQSLLRGVWDEDGVMGATTAWHVVRALSCAVFFSALLHYVQPGIDAHSHCYLLASLCADPPGQNVVFCIVLGCLPVG
jgi:hypothetical protein